MRATCNDAVLHEARMVLMRCGMNRFLSLAFVFAATACAVDKGAITPGTDELGQEGNDGEESKADSAHNDFDYLLVTKTGTCTNPITCAPYELTRVNRSSLKCNDGLYHASCTVKAVNFGNLAAAQALEDAIDSGSATVLVKGRFKIYVDFLAFEASEAWLSQIDGGAIDATWVRMSDNGRRCIDAPCASIHEERLNSTRAMDIDGFDFSDDVSQDLQDKVYSQITKADGAIVVGGRAHGTLMHLPTTLRSVDQVFLPQN